MIERNTASGLDPYGQTIPPLWTAMSELIPCFVYARAKRQIVQNEGTVIIENIRAMFPKGADVRQGDRIASLSDRLGVIVWQGPMMVDTILPRPDHLEALLRRVE